MSLDNILLNNEAFQILFAKNLIEDIGKQHVTEILKKPEIKYLGENKKNILFLVNDDLHTFTGDAEMEMLTNLVAACKLTLADIALVNFNNNPVPYIDLNTHFSPNKILIFGVSGSQLDLPFTIPFFQIQSFNGQIYLLAPPLKEFINNASLKGQLWSCLKKLFLNQ